MDALNVGPNNPHDEQAHVSDTKHILTARCINGTSRIIASGTKPGKGSENSNTTMHSTLSIQFLMFD